MKNSVVSCSLLFGLLAVLSLAVSAQPLDEADSISQKRMSALIGQQAPDLADVAAWKNSKPLKMAGLRGKYVLLDFWGVGCGLCVAEMPLLFSLHDKFAKRGLVIIGVHVDDSIASVAEFDKALDPIRKESWKGRDLPFPVAMVVVHPTNTESEEGFSCRAIDDYGVVGFPSQVLIDPAGKVVGWFNWREHTDLFESLPEAE